MRTVTRPTRLDGLAPVEVAGRLRHLDGLVFFDTAGNFPASGSRPVSVIAARPERVLKGSIFSTADRETLRTALAAGPKLAPYFKPGVPAAQALAAFRKDTGKAAKLATQPIGPADKGADLAELAAWTAVAGVAQVLFGRGRVAVAVYQVTFCLFIILGATDSRAPAGFAPGNVVCNLPGYQLLDSLAVEAGGKVCVATIINGGITVFDPDGTTEHFAFPDVIVTNICFGGPDMRDAWITASGTGKLYKARWPRPGLKLNFNA